MTSTDAQRTGRSRPLLAIISFSAVVAILATVGVLYAAGWLTIAAPSRQAQVHSMGAQVMPLDLDKTTHIFRMTETGGVQQVVAKAVPGGRFLGPGDLARRGDARSQRPASGGQQRSPSATRRCRMARN
jgi:hypothetical protein